MNPRSNRKTSTWSAVTLNKTLDLNELLSWACDMVTWCLSADTLFGRCQLIITSNTKEVHSKPRLHVSLSTCYLDYGRHVARIRRRRRRHCAYAPTSNTASHDNHEKINSWVSFVFHIWVAYGAPLGGPSGRRSSAIRVVTQSLSVEEKRCVTTLTTAAKETS